MEIIKTNSKILAMFMVAVTLLVGCNKKDNTSINAKEGTN